MLQDERGGISVFLAGLFLIVLTVFFALWTGMKGYLGTGITERAMIAAGQDVMANYDKALFTRYHIFFLDPRERSQIAAEGKKALEKSAEGSAAFPFSLKSLDVTREKTALDEDGRYLKHEIREWMKYQNIKKAGTALQQLFSAADALESGKDGSLSALNQIPEDDGGSEAQEGASESTETETADTVQKKGKWKEIRETIDAILRGGVLYYAVDDLKSISALSIETEGLPSVTEGKTGNGFLPDDWSFSLAGLKELKSALSGSGNISFDSTLVSEDYYMLGYIFSCFSHYQAEETEEDTCLKYEVEYLIAGKDNDFDNLKAVANRILFLRFLTNYISASGNAQLKGQAQAMALAVSGFLGLPQATQAVEALLLSAISYGESLLELHTLLNGGKIPVVKTADTWNLDFENAAVLLKEKRAVKKGAKNIGYSGYLKLLTALPFQSGTLCWRMMDVMQSNVALEEPGFQMGESLFSFQWSGKFLCDGWFSMELKRWNSY